MKSHRPSPPAVAAFVATVILVLVPAARAMDPSVRLNLYGNVNYAVEKEGTAPTTNTFSVPQFDLFFSSELDRVTFSAEAIFDFDGDTNEINVDLDRLQLSYLFRSWLRVTAGRFHNALGFYNTAYPHGAAFYELPIDRPAIVDSHEADSLLPTLGVGLRLDGRLPLGAAGFASYDVEITNGRGITPGEITTFIDHNGSKAYNLRLRFEPAFLDGLIIGGNAYLDNIPSSAALPIAMQEQIFGAHIAYVEAPYHLILEGAVIRHLGDDGSRFQTLAALGQFGYSFGNFTPYLRVELARFPKGTVDPFYALGNQAANGDYAAFSAGLKYLVSSALAFKVELEDSRGTITEIRSATTQAAFSF